MANVFWRIGCAAALAGAAGGGGREFAEVEGTVTLDGRPLPDAEVTFLPDPLAGNAGNSAVGHTDAQGRYRLRSVRDGRDGAVTGAHRVVVLDLTAVPDIDPGGGGRPGAAAAARPKKADKPRFPPEYADPLRTPLAAVEVKSGRQTLDFDLKGK